MFGQYHQYIPKHHHPALESVLRNHSVVTSVSAQLLAKMYKLAIEGLRMPVNDIDFYTSTLTAGNVILSSVTERKTGLWLQLAQVDSNSPLLTVGQKWIMDQSVPAHGSTATRFW